jgi:hypothetical protein
MSQPNLRICRVNAERFALPCPEWAAGRYAVDCVSCLAQCGDGEAGPFVEVDGVCVFADDLAELSRRLAERHD